jgi:hypothetical protein
VARRACPGIIYHPDGLTVPSAPPLCPPPPQIVRWKFSQWQLTFEREPLWPQIDDLNHGHVEGLQFYPRYKGMSAAELQEQVKDRHGQVMKPGFTGAKWDGKTPTWHALDARYDQVRCGVWERAGRARLVGIAWGWSELGSVGC